MGYDKYQELLGRRLDVLPERIARVSAEDKNSVSLFSVHGDIHGILRGSFRKNFSENNLPKVGDFVEIEKLQGEQKAIITKILPRITTVGRFWAATHREQIIVTNVDTLFITESFSGQINLDRIERMILAAKQTGCTPVIILNKLDIADESGVVLLKRLGNKLKPIQIIPVSAREHTGIEQIESLIRNNLGAAFIGSSGVGKSSLINALTHSNTQTTQGVRDKDSKGKHTTTRREMYILKTGGIIIDTPGLREFENKSENLPAPLFVDIEPLTLECKFTDCDHSTNPGCAVIGAVENGVLTKERYILYMESKAPKPQKRVRLSRKPGTQPKRPRNI